MDDDDDDDDNGGDAWTRRTVTKGRAPIGTAPGLVHVACINETNARSVTGR